MRIQHDAIPGTPAHMWFKPTKIGEWQMICGQLCGTNHSAMAGELSVVEAAEYDTWYKGKADSARPKPKEGLGAKEEPEPKVTAR